MLSKAVTILAVRTTGSVGDATAVTGRFGAFLLGGPAATAGATAGAGYESFFRTRNRFPMRRNKRMRMGASARSFLQELYCCAAILRSASLVFTKVVRKPLFQAQRTWILLLAFTISGVSLERLLSSPNFIPDVVIMPMPIRFENLININDRRIFSSIFFTA